MLNKTTRLTLPEQVVQQMEALIESGKWPVGKKIPSEPELMEMLQISRNSLREAVKALTHTGLLRTKQGDGTYVCASSALGTMLKRRLQKTSMLDILEVRFAIEREVARLSATRRSEADMERILFYMKQCDELQTSEDRTAYIEADLLFHLALVESTGNPLMIDMYSNIMDVVQLSVLTAIERSRQCLLSQMHHKLVEAIAAQDPEQAAEAVQEDMDALRNIFMEMK
ncbi:FadR family transcriptional regulator [Paenibacillus sp. N1-5-1-14]|uniref:FadR/GntR family transcriptional regulator n=1 Tax=Paenibacillus radicibacter TaxID=2972488 RepID=UPI0021596EF7|nr:FadR/GntR family transcriptional regulator [Paenibacillus radicibacter]MCR8642854.1 FadR family transcriptional regulator [Paenibacillus radicibacter]